MRHQYHLDPGALRNGYYWKFTDKVYCPSGRGAARAPNLYANGAVLENCSLKTLRPRAKGPTRSPAHMRSSIAAGSPALPHPMKRIFAEWRSRAHCCRESDNSRGCSGSRFVQTHRRHRATKELTDP